jgi:hypothetical protein
MPAQVVEDKVALTRRFEGDRGGVGARAGDRPTLRVVDALCSREFERLYVNGRPRRTIAVGGADPLAAAPPAIGGN